MSLVFALVCSLTLLFTLVKRKDLFSPGRIYILIYSFLLAIYSLGLSRLQTPWTLTTRVCFWGSALCFLAACLAVFCIDRIKNPFHRFDFERVKSRLHEDARRLDWNWFTAIWAVCAALFIASYAGAYVTMREIPIFAEHPDKARLGFLNANLFIATGWFCGPMSMMLALEMLFFARLRGIRKWIVVIVSLFVGFLYITLITRFGIFRTTLFGLMVYHYGKRHLAFRHLAVCIVALALLFASTLVVRIGTDPARAYGEIEQVKMPAKYSWFANPYAYVACNFWNMDNGFAKFAEGYYYYPRTWGFELFRSFFFVSGLEGVMVNTYGFDSIFNDSIRKAQGYNSALYVWHFYKDFGITGVFVLSFLFGLLLAVYYYNTMKKPTLVRMALWVFFASMILFSFNSPQWGLWFIYLNLGFTVLAHRRLPLDPARTVPEPV